jgi:ketosteroid isomerase-like protein
MFGIMPADLFRASCAGCLVILLVITRLAAQQTSPSAGTQGTAVAQRAVKEVLEMKRQYDEALLRGDSAWFERAFAEDYLLILGDASTVTKAQIVKGLASKEVTWQAANGRDMQVRLYGDIAIVTGRFSGKLREKGKSISTDERFTSVWIKNGDRWKAVSEHVSEMPAR